MIKLCDTNLCDIASRILLCLNFYAIRVPKKASSGNNATAIEAIEKIVQEKKISTKINYDVLRSLTGPLISGASKNEDTCNTTSLDNAESSGLFGESSIRNLDLKTSPPSAKNQRKIHSTYDRKELNALNVEDSQPSKRRLPSIGASQFKRNRTLSSTIDSTNHKQSIDKDTTPQNNLDNREVVVESGPVSSDVAAYENDEMDDEDEEDEEEIPQSAAELLSKHRGDDGTELSDWEEEYY